MVGAARASRLSEPSPRSRATRHGQVDGPRRSREPLNGLMETVIGLFKTECIGTTLFHQGPYKALADVEYATAGWIDWYNHRRLHGSLGMVPPAEFEQAHYAALTPQEQPICERHESRDGFSAARVGSSSFIAMTLRRSTLVMRSTRRGRSRRRS
jgi:hypothetical protein